ncbi:MAG: hypothetical protein KI790_06015 [Cyclobacteriaceae bacterium]|nr:hypothetical protein [Cyclobacteriaceae bacterium HetDA_MAG_MS6]
MYSFLLNAHSGLRWLVLLLVLILIVKSLIGLFSGGKYAKLDNILAASYVGTMHLQLLIGIVLYFFLSPITDIALRDFGGAMKDDELRFWAVEHISVMILAAVAAQAGRSISKKSDDDVVKFRFQAIFFGVSLLLMLFGIPWDRI